MRRAGITKTNRIDVFVVAGNLDNRLACLDVVDVYRPISRTSNNFSSVAGESQRPNLRRFSWLPLDAATNLH